METKLTFAKIENNQAMLSAENSVTVAIPCDFLPKDAVEGDKLVLSIKTEAQDAKEKELTAKDILNELLDVKEDIIQKK